jgi:hypothetical protein
MVIILTTNCNTQHNMLNITVSEHTAVIESEMAHVISRNMPQEMRMKLIQSIHSGNQVVANYIKAQHN